jgi:hypothetical protein
MLTVPLLLDGVLLASIAATSGLIAVTYAAALIGYPYIDLLMLLGRRTTADQRLAIITGGVLQYASGFIFTLIYVALWHWGVGRPVWYWGMIFGFFHGALACTALPGLLHYHPRPPRVPVWATAFLEVLLAHLVYGWLAATVYQMFLVHRGGA